MKQAIYDLQQAFRESRNQCLLGTESSKKTANKKAVTRRGHKTKYEIFLSKYEDLENTIDSFNSQDLLFLFREKAEESGYKYVIPNIQRDLGVIKTALNKGYTPRDLGIMIEFIFCSNQNYIDKSRVSPTILSSQWCNTLYRDSQLWIDDKYVPKKSKSAKTTREWNGSKDTEDIKVGEW